MKAFFAFIAGFFRIHAPESSTRLVGIASFFVGLALAIILIVCACLAIAHHEITVTDLVVLVIVFSYACVALNLRSPIPPEVIAQLAGVKLPEQKPDVKVETTTTTSTEVKPNG